MAFGILASRAGYMLEIEVLQSAAGFYIGTAYNMEGPISRESVEYFPSYEKASEALATGNWTQRDHP